MTEKPSEDAETRGAGASVPQAESKRKLVPRRPVSSSTNARLTLVFLGTIFSVCFFAWGGAKMACNHHPPSYQAFKPAPLKKLAKSPKDAALEFQHRLFTSDFAGARELVLPDAASLVSDAESQCDSECKTSAAQRREASATRATLLNRAGGTAKVRVESQLGQQELAATYELKYESPIWKVLRKVD